MPIGAGSAGAGLSPVGLDPVLDPTKRPVRRPPKALLFDIATRSFLQNADGTLATVDTVDQQVALALGITQGTVASVTTLGNVLRKVARGSTVALVAECTDAVERALHALIARSDIAVTDVTVKNPARGQVLTAVTYLNLRTQVSKTVSFKTAL